MVEPTDGVVEIKLHWIIPYMINTDWEILHNQTLSF